MKCRVVRLWRGVLARDRFRLNRNMLRFYRGIERVVGRIPAREQCVAAVGRHLDRTEQRAVVRNLGVDLVVVEVHLAVRQCAGRLAVLADVGDHHDVGQQLRIISHSTEFDR